MDENDCDSGTQDDLLLSAGVGRSSAIEERCTRDYHVQEYRVVLTTSGSSSSVLSAANIDYRKCRFLHVSAAAGQRRGDTTYSRERMWTHTQRVGGMAGAAVDVGRYSFSAAPFDARVTRTRASMWERSQE